MNSYLSWAYLFVVGQGLLLAFLLFFRKGLANRIFSALTFIITWEIFSQYLFRWCGAEQFSFMFHLRDLSLFLYGPLLYLYFSASTGRMSSLSPSHLLHFVPPVFLANLRSVSGGAAFTIDLSIFPRGIPVIVTFSAVYYLLVLVSTGVYLYFCVRLLSGYLRRTRKTAHASDIIRRRWMITLSAYAFIILALFCVSTVMHLSGSPYSAFFSHLFCSCIAVSILFTGYTAVRRNEVYNVMHGLDRVDDSAPGAEAADTGEKYAKTRLPDDVRDAYLGKILDLLDREQIYLDPEITLADFADRAGIAAHHVSQVINTRMSHNFYTLMNSRRIDHAKTLLLHPDSADKTVLDIAFESGFNSKTTFNTVFKEMTGMTPTTYRSGMCARGVAAAGKRIPGEMLVV